MKLSIDQIKADWGQALSDAIAAGVAEAKKKTVKAPSRHVAKVGG